MEIPHNKVRTLSYTNEEPLEALKFARNSATPVLLPIGHIHQDTRGWSFMNMLTDILEKEGQLNFSHIHPNVIKAWHRHLKQTDFWIVVQGDLKIGLARENSGTMSYWSVVLGEHKPGILVIPPGLWHGCAVTTPYPAGLLYYVDKAYDVKNPDEERKSYKYFEFNWGIDHS